MPALPQTDCRRHWRRALAALGALVLLGGCAGDFGQVRPDLVRDDMHDWVGRAATAGASSEFALTDEERALRDLAYPLIEPPYDRNKWYSVVGEYGVIGASWRGSFDRTAYTTRLLTTRYRSPAARYAQLIDDIRNDQTRLPQFYQTAARVLDMDARRRASFAAIPDLSPRERENALARIRENAGVVAWVHSSIVERASAYRFALQRLVVMTPSPLAGEAELAINRLLAENAHYRISPPPPPQVATAR